MEQNEPAFARLGRSCDFYFVRHGESESNEGGKIAGREDPPLSARGREQAAGAAEWFRSRQIGRIFSSPLVRAAETARIIADGCGLPSPVEDDRIVELDTGIFSGLTFAEIRDRYPADYDRFRAGSWEAVPGAERIRELRERAISFWNHLIDVANEGVAAVVSVAHGGILQWIIKATTGGTRWVPVFGFSNCAIYQLHVEPVHPESYFAEWPIMNLRPY